MRYLSSMNEAWVVRCRGLPYSITKKDVEVFLNTSTLAYTTDESIHITYNKEGTFLAFLVT